LKKRTKTFTSLDQFFGKARHSMREFFASFFQKRRPSFSAHWLATWHVLLICITGAALSLAYIAAVTFARVHKGPALDFVTFWTAGRLALQGHAALAYDETAIGALQRATVDMTPPNFFPFFYPPILFLLFAPLAALPYGLAFFTFGASQWALLVTLLRRILPAPWPLSTLIAAPALLLNFGVGQNSALMASCFAIGCLMLETRPVLAGAALGCLIFKPHLALLVPVALAVTGRWRALLAAGGAVLALTAASLICGVQPWVQFLHAAVRARNVLEGFSDDWIKMISPFAALRLHGAGLRAAYVGQAACTMVGLCALFLVRRADGTWLVATLAAATLLLSPYVFDYDLTLTLIPIAVLASAAGREGWNLTEKMVCAIGFFSPFAIRLLALDSAIGLQPFVTLALLAVLVRRARLAMARFPPSYS
jgi:alpha-1,2-mannosyltransferase